MKKISQILEELIERHEKYKKLRLFSVSSLWKKVVGENIASKAKVVDFIDGKLVVVCSDPMWRAELELRKNAIASRINEEIGKKLVKTIVLRRG